MLAVMAGNFFTAKKNGTAYPTGSVLDPKSQMDIHIGDTVYLEKINRMFKTDAFYIISSWLGQKQYFLTESEFADIFGIEKVKTLKAKMFRACTYFDYGNDVQFETKSLNKAKSFLKKCAAKGWIEADFGQGEHWACIFKYDAEFGIFKRHKIYDGLNEGPYLKFET